MDHINYFWNNLWCVLHDLFATVFVCGRQKGQFEIFRIYLYSSIKFCLTTPLKLVWKNNFWYWNENFAELPFAQPSLRHDFKTKAKKMLDGVFLQAHSELKCGILNKHDRSYLPGFGWSNTGYNRWENPSSFILRSAVLTTIFFSFRVRLTLVLLGKAPLQYHTEGRLRINKETKIQQFSHNFH